MGGSLRAPHHQAECCVRWSTELCAYRGLNAGRGYRADKEMSFIMDGICLLLLGVIFNVGRAGEPHHNAANVDH